jgi:hypothetical protein
MDRCFVMQPFDGGPFDKRFDDVLGPAITEAGLEPYRVDRDPGTVIPIEDIEKGIRDSRLCLAEITTDNPNVWFELGYAIGVQKDVILVCCADRKSRFPFDIQHRRIIEYASDSPQDFQKLREQVVQAIRATTKRQRELAKLSRLDSAVKTEGLQSHEIVCLATVMQNRLTPSDTVTAYQIQQDMDKAGYNSLATSLALESLLQMKMIRTVQEYDQDGGQYLAYRVIDGGIEWLMRNQDRLLLQKPVDDIPF